MYKYELNMNSIWTNCKHIMNILWTSSSKCTKNGTYVWWTNSILHKFWQPEWIMRVWKSACCTIEHKFVVIAHKLEEIGSLGMWNWLNTTRCMLENLCMYTKFWWLCVSIDILYKIWGISLWNLTIDFRKFVWFAQDLEKLLCIVTIDKYICWQYAQIQRVVFGEYDNEIFPV